MVMPGAEEAGVGKGRRTGSLGQGFDRVQLVPPGSICMTTHHRAGSEKQPVGPESQLWRVRQDFDPHSLASDSILITGKGPRKSLRILEKLHPIISLGPSWKQTAPSNGVTDGVQ